MDISTPPLAHIRMLRASDPQEISEAFSRQGWHKPTEQYERYFSEQQAGTRLVLIAVVQERFAGYLTVLWQSHYGPFHQAGIPEIADFNVLIHFRRQGIGSLLMDNAEARIAARSPIAGIGVGLTADYGPAQVLYVQRGYVPDGRGLHWRDRPCTFGDHVIIDDDLVLYLMKHL